MDMIDLYDRSSAWAGSKIPAATGRLDDSTPCEEWKVRDVINHMVSVQSMFAGAARGAPAGPPPGDPPDVMGDDPAETYEDARRSVLDAFREEGALDRAGQILAIGVVDQLVHGWDLAKATGQDTTMPEDLAEAAYGVVGGRIDDPAMRGALFKPAVDVGEDASVQDKLVAYLGRQP